MLHKEEGPKEVNGAVVISDAFNQIVHNQSMPDLNTISWIATKCFLELNISSTDEVAVFPESGSSQINPRSHAEARESV